MVAYIPVGAFLDMPHFYLQFLNAINTNWSETWIRLGVIRDTNVLTVGWEFSHSKIKVHSKVLIFLGYRGQL